MTVHTLDTSFQYPAPDMKKIKESREALNYKIRTLSTIYLPVLREQLDSLQEELNSTDKQALSSLTLIPTALPIEEIQRFHTTIEKLKLETPTPEQQEAIDSFYKEIKTLIEGGTSETLKLFIALDNNLTNLKAVTLSDNQYRIKELETSISDATPYIPEEERAIARLVKDESELNEAIKLIEATDTFSLIKEFFLTAERLATLNLSAPQVELVKAGITAAGKILNLISDRIKYDNLIQARSQIQKQLDDRRRNLARINQDIKILQDQKNQVEEFQSVQTPRESYTQELSVLADAINKFLELTEHDGNDDLESVVKRFIEHSDIFRKHLKSLRGQWKS
ncbi:MULTISPECIES: alpha-xenorhabdolysin family binary toxin subunit B [unclassified Pseudomonas]|uniref:alpha-xenorhabdolysin family binary toxin subunit B n=1 Tax=unclassified Pseudomonas TaxID=196821 RepID=UPI001CBBE1D1|nr:MULTISPECIES: alpha-xenorhabdolysin family binary toxin subunit B [unclassified Pseudomonas]